MSESGKSILLFCPTYLDDDGDMVVRERTKASIEALKWDGKLTVEYSTHNPYPLGVKDSVNILLQYQRARAMCIEGDYDALLTVEHDMVLPADTLEKLWAVDKPVVYSVYVMRHGPLRLSAWTVKRPVEHGLAIDLHPEEYRNALEKKVVPVTGIGTGCTLIRREVLEKIDFRREGGGYRPAHDIGFAMDLMDAGIEQYAHFDAPSGHILPTGEVLWPPWVDNQDGIIMWKIARYIAHENYGGQVGIRNVQLNAGDEYELNMYDAAPLVREGILGLIR